MGVTLAGSSRHVQVPAGDGRPRPLVSFMFDCGTIAADTPIRPQLVELDEYLLVAAGQAAGLFPAWAGSPPRSRRHTGTTVYMPDSHNRLTRDWTWQDHVHSHVRDRRGAAPAPACVIVPAETWSERLPRTGACLEHWPRTTPQ
jgi:hypothetical protein